MGRGGPDAAHVLSLLTEASSIYAGVEALTHQLRAAADAQHECRLEELLAERERQVAAAAAVLEELGAAVAADSAQWRRYRQEPAIADQMGLLIARLDAIRASEAATAQLLLDQRGQLQSQVMRLREGRVQLQGYAALGRAAATARVDRRR